MRTPTYARESLWSGWTGKDGNMKTKYDMGSTVLVPCEVKKNKY